MRIRLTQPGFENYTGQMGVLDFVDGLSTGPVSAFDALRLSAAMSVETEDGRSVSLAQTIIDHQDFEANYEEPLERGVDEVDQAPEAPSEVTPTEEVPTEDAPVEAPAPAPAPEPEPVVDTTPYEMNAEGYTEAELERIADEQGIAGLREIAEPLGIKGRSVVELIRGLLRAGAAPEAPTE